MMDYFAEHTNLGGPVLKLRFPSENARNTFCQAFPDNCKPVVEGPIGPGSWKMSPRYGGSDACGILATNNGLIWEPKA